MSHLHSQLTIDLFMYIVFKSDHIHMISIKILYLNTFDYSFLVTMNHVNSSSYLLKYKSIPGKRLQIVHAKLHNIHATINTQYINVTQFL